MRQLHYHRRIVTIEYRVFLLAVLAFGAASGCRHKETAAPAIATRHTNRRFYRRQPVDAAARLAMADAVAVIPGARLQWLDDAPLRAAALHAIRIAETERFRRPALHAELFGNLGDATRAICRQVYLCASTSITFSSRG